MANVSHAGLTGTDLHEPKGVASANSGDSYTANGTGSGAWVPGNKTFVSLIIDDINAAASHWIVMPANGTITNWWAVTDQDPGADATLTLEIAGTLVTDSSLVIATSGWALNDVFSAVPTANNTITAGAALEIVNDGGASATSTTCTFTIETTRA